MLGKLAHFAKISSASAAVRGLLAAPAIGAMPTVALAHRHDRDDFRRHEWRRDDDRHDRDHGGGRFDIRIGGGTYDPCPPPPICPPQVCPPQVCPPRPAVCEQSAWVEPVYRTVCDRRWVEPAYRTVCDRVWIEPVTRTECERTWIPDRYEWRNIDQWANGRHYTAHEYVLVEPAHRADVPHTVVIAPGHYEDRPRQELVCEGHFESFDCQEVVVPGHWETRPVIVAAPLPRYEESHARIDVRIPF